MEVIVTIYKDKVELESKGSILHTYVIKDLKFHELAKRRSPAVCAEILDKLYWLQDLGYKIKFKYGESDGQ